MVEQVKPFVMVLCLGLSILRTRTCWKNGDGCQFICFPPFVLQLQKYRLHTRRMPNTSAAPPSNQSVVVLGSLWMPQDQYGDSSKASSSQSASPQGPLQLGRATGGTSTTGGDSMEDDEDEKSESYSWKSQVHKSGKEDV